MSLFFQFQFFVYLLCNLGWSSLEFFGVPQSFGSSPQIWRRIERFLFCKFEIQCSKSYSQQEARIARAVEIMLMYVDNLKRNCEREHTELEESRKLLAANNLSVEDQWRSAGSLGEPVSSSSPTIGRPNSRGRSVSVIHPNQGSPTNTLGAALVSFF